MKKLFIILIIIITILFGTVPAYAAVFSQDIRVLVSTATYKSMNITVTGDYYVKEAPEFDLTAEDLSIWIEDGQPVIRSSGHSFSSKTITLISGDYSGTSDFVGFFNANYGYCTYIGNIQFTAVDGSIRAINTLPMEHYLYGVVPNEMSNRFPLESLKAQAVCARSYALSKCLANRDLSYDVLDTVDHQVYWGYNSSYSRAISAVDATSGQVLTDDGSIIQAFYTASNGGQTELTGNVWSESLPYYVMKDDIFDLANPFSPEQKTFIPDEFNSDGTRLMDDLVLSLLQTKANAAAGDIVTLLSTVNVKPYSPLYAPPSRSYAQVDVVLMVSNSKGQTGQLTVTIDYNELIQSNTNPSGVFNVSTPYLKLRGAERGTAVLSGPDQTQVSGWYLTNRRYGHGVGLSQRGAQARATSGQTYQTILNFYYDQTRLVTYKISDSDSVISSDKYPISDIGVTGVGSGTEARHFVDAFTTEAGKLSLVGADGAPKESGSVVTGDTLQCVYDDGSAILNLPVIVIGDLDSDGLVSNHDVSLLQWHLLGTRELTGASLSAADANQDGVVNGADMLLIIWHINGKQKIS
jgi:peptidoglycan hydrolase-like amidase